MYLNRFPAHVINNNGVDGVRCELHGANAHGDVSAVFARGQVEHLYQLFSGIFGQHEPTVVAVESELCRLVGALNGVAQRTAGHLMIREVRYERALAQPGRVALLYQLTNVRMRRVVAQQTTGNLGGHVVNVDLHEWLCVAQCSFDERRFNARIENKVRQNVLQRQSLGFVV